MPVTIRQVGPCFAGEVSGIDMRKPMTAEEVAAIHAGMDKYAVLVFRDQDIDDAQQLAFTRSLGDIEHAIGTSLRAANETRLPTTFADVSNLDKDNKPYAYMGRYGDYVVVADTTRRGYLFRVDVGATLTYTGVWYYAPTTTGHGLAVDHGGRVPEELLDVVLVAIRRR